MRPLAYIAGPFAPQDDDPDPTFTIGLHIRQATMLGQYAIRLGCAPIVPHLLGDRLYGEDGDPECRALALECGTAHAAHVARLRGTLFVIQRLDGSLSFGTRLEVEAFKTAWRRHQGVTRPDIRMNTWRVWKALMTRKT